jgi:N-acetylglutamate synthase-like GNAT family acetyltransferase
MPPTHQELDELIVRAGRLSEAPRLREILADAKGHWGYEVDLLRRWIDSYDFDELFRTREMLVAEAAGAVVGWASLVPPVDDVAVLDDLWVEPVWIGKRVGSRLFARARDRATELGASQMTWETEPNAIGFYERMGGRYIREETSEWGRRLQIMAVDLKTGP